MLLMQRLVTKLLGREDLTRVNIRIIGISMSNPQSSAIRHTMSNKSFAKFGRSLGYVGVTVSMFNHYELERPLATHPKLRSLFATRCTASSFLRVHSSMGPDG